MAMRNKLLRIFFDVDFRNRHEGLRNMMRKKGLNIEDMEEDDMVVFLNRRKDKIMALKILPEDGSYGVLGYYRTPKGDPLDYRSIKFIPGVFGGASINMDEATRRMLEQELPLIAKKGTAGEHLL